MYFQIFNLHSIFNIYYRYRYVRDVKIRRSNRYRAMKQVLNTIVSTSVINDDISHQR